MTNKNDKDVPDRKAVIRALCKMMRKPMNFPGITQKIERTMTSFSNPKKKAIRQAIKDLANNKVDMASLSLSPL